MSRVYFVHDAQGERQLAERDLPLAVGGAQAGDIVPPGLPADALVAHIALAEGHAFIQPAGGAWPLFHNHEHLTSSRWLKSGDLVEIGDSVIRWMVQGDQVDIRVQARPTASGLVPPSEPPPSSHRVLPEIAPAAAPPRGRGIAARLAAGAFVLLLLVAAFVLLATPFAVQITPASARASVEGFPPAISLAGRWLALPGRYRVTAEHAGYRPLHQTIDVTRGGKQAFGFALEELPGQVTIDLQPAVPFTLRIDGVEVETKGGGPVAIPGGMRGLRIETERYLPIEEDLEVTGKGQAQRFARMLQPAWAMVHIDSEPPGAAVRVDGRLLGVTPLGAELLHGRRRLGLSLDGYKAFSVDQPVQAGVERVLDPFQLQPLDGRLLVRSEPTAASVSVDGSFQGVTPVTLALEAGVAHRVRLSKPGYRDFEVRQTLAADEEQTLNAELSAQYGVVFVTAQPADARLRVDGRDVGRATQRLELTTRRHTLDFSKPGYVSKTVEVTPRTGSSQNLDVVLTTTAQQRARQQALAIPALITTPAGQRLGLVRPRGSFRMGASRREAGRRANESRRLVELTRPFYLSQTEVSNAQYRQFRPGHDSGSADGAGLNADSQPVVNVSWDDAARYCNWLSGRAGLSAAYIEVNGRMAPAQPMTTGYRLVSEAEWSYVARKHGRQSERRYPWDGDYPPRSVVGNFADASLEDGPATRVPGYNDGHRGAAPVGSFPAGPDAFHDLGGNVAEWMHDYYAVYPGEADRLVTDPLGPAAGEHHVVRDSSWRRGSIAELRLSYRDYSRVARPDLGFRIARYAE